jgi:hypothetical protein
MTPTWYATDFDQGTDDGLVHENTADTAYTNASEARKGDATASPLYSADLVAWYPLQEPSGTTLVDFSGNNYDGTYNGVTLGGGDTLRGILSHSWDGNDDYADTGQKFEYMNNGQFTVCWWMYVLSSSRSFIFDTGNGSSSNNGFAADYSSKGNNLLDLAPRSTGNNPRLQITIPTGEWHHVAWTWDEAGNANGEVRAYKDGSVGDSSSAPNISASSIAQTMQLGHIDGSFDLSYPGYLFDFRLYNRTLSASEVQELYDVWANPSTHTSVVKSG